jgi:branched-chain amino acid aminotransferase
VVHLTTSTPETLTTQLKIWLDGRLYDDPRQATIAGTDHGLLVGDGVFETLKVTEQGAFAIRRHLNRMTRSAAALGLPPPDHALIRAAIAAVLENRDFALGKLRITYTGGRGPLGSEAAYGPPTLIVALAPVNAAPPLTSIVTAPWRRNERGALTGVKSTSYAENVRGLGYAAALGAGEAIFLNTADHVCEGTGTNIFLVFKDVITTPPLSSGPLAGVTRELIMEWSPVEERELTLEEAKRADEVFLTSSMRDIQGVERWDDRTFSSARPVTQALSVKFVTRTEADLDP